MDDQRTNYEIRMDGIADRIAALRIVVNGHRDDLNLPGADAVEEISALINATFDAYPNLCPDDDEDKAPECDGRCNHALATIAAIAIHCLAETDFGKD